ncbi:hypothetical protein ACQPYK_21020 [Streptosporangium sp. CA-135522]|uniref:hypothetical protein n=1 Tax=Streptosporangium sp. CA-135522 TaxID=3240072 RepID=UPI003D940565
MTRRSNNKPEFRCGASTGIPAADGRRFAELNADQVSTFYQDSVPNRSLTVT